MDSASVDLYDSVLDDVVVAEVCVRVVNIKLGGFEKWVLAANVELGWFEDGVLDVVVIDVVVLSKITELTSEFVVDAVTRAASNH